VYAGAAREAVFSVPAVVRRVNADFVPLALRAPLVNGADFMTDQDEQWLYQRINRAKLAPQGICVLNSSGQVLTWVQMFDSDQSVLAFLDHARKRFQKHAGAKPLVPTERYMRFPSDRARDVLDEARLPVVARGHPKGKTCPAKYAKGKAAPGALVAQLVGRALDKQGKPLADTVKQEHYVEDQFTVIPEMQAAVARALANAGKGAVRLPDEFATLCATHAHLGHIDVRPLFGVGGHQNRGKWKRCEFRAVKVEAGRETTLWRVQGESEVVSLVAINGKGVHDVKLAWEGFLTLKGKRMIRLLLSARGTEKLQFAKDDHPLKKVKRDEVAFLPGGRPIDLEGGVRYGIIGEPVAADQGAPEEQARADQVPFEAQRQLIQALGTASLVFRDRVQAELNLSDEQKKQLAKQLQETARDAMKFFAKIKDLRPEERPQEHQAFHQKTAAKLAVFLQKTLTRDQRQRLRQVELQQEGLFALFGQPPLQDALKVTDEQKRQFMVVVQEMQRQIQQQLKKIQSGGKPEEVLPRVMKIRKEHEGKIEALLTGAQKRRWKTLLGKPLALGD
jgi:hypothetical protein